MFTPLCSSNYNTTRFLAQYLEKDYILSCNLKHFTFRFSLTIAPLLFGYTIPTIRACSGLAPIGAHPWFANTKRCYINIVTSFSISLFVLFHKQSFIVFVILTKLNLFLYVHIDVFYTNFTYRTEYILTYTPAFNIIRGEASRKLTLK